MKDKNELQDARVVEHPFVEHGDLPRQATGPSERRLPDWENVAEAVKMPGGVVILTLLNGEIVEVTSAELSRIVQSAAALG